MQMTNEQIEQGKRNYQSLWVNRRDFLKASAAVPAVGALYFGYRELHGSPVRAGIVGTGNEGCGAMIDQSPPGFLEYVAYHDIRPSQIARGRKQFVKLYGPAQGNKVKFYDTYEAMLADPSIEAIVVATPLWTHADLTIKALEAGKHVLCEKLMAHNITDAKRMVRAADSAGKILSIGHQRHYSTLYADALVTVQSGTLGDVKHIRALWHRNNAQLDPETKEYRDSWKPPIPDDDKSIDFAKYGYKNLEELVRWRLYNRTGGGLMAELGSHQLDACSIFLGKVHPIAVSGVGGKFFYDDERECEDHVYCTFEMPNGVVVTYSSINTNAMEGYGEEVMGTRGTLMVMHERDVLLFNERDPFEGKRDSKKIDVKVAAAKKGESTMYSAGSIGLTAEAAKQTTTAAVSRGYKEEMEHFAFCIRHPDPENKVRCDGRVALADAVMALTANQAMRTGTRIEFKDSWYDPNSDDVPDAKPAETVPVA
jgi:predicted dehydrogenase